MARSDRDTDGDPLMPGRVEGKVAIVTGAARGMGRAVSELLVAEGARVILSDLLTDAGEETAASIGDGARFVAHDVTDYAQWQSAVAAAEETAGPVSVLVNCAGVGTMGTFDDSGPEDYRRVIDVNQVSVFLGIKAVLDSMRRAGGGSIVNISSAAGFVGIPGMSAYVSSKFAVRGITKTAALELAPHGIRVNSVHPGAVDTEMLRSSPLHEQLVAGAAQTALGRIADADEIAPVVLFLASDESSFATGSEFVVDGGWTCQ